MRESHAQCVRLGMSAFYYLSISAILVGGRGQSSSCVVTVCHDADDMSEQNQTNRLEVK